MILFLDLRSNNVVLKAIPLTQIGRKKFYRTAIKLNAMWFGVPQKRKRVFIIGSLDPNIDFIQPLPLFDDDNIFLPKPITVRDAIGGLPEIENGGGALEIEWEFDNPCPYDLLMQRKLSFNEFYQIMKDKEGK